MCGIAGLVGNFQNRDLLLQEMLNSLVHRGPDEEQKYVHDIYCGGMRRLSINDLKGGSQPFLSNSETIAVFYNGEIYNYPELRKNLESKGKVFRGHSDGEVIPHLYEEVGEEVFSYLDGMFAIAIWDLRKRSLILGRDMPGEKPLYYSHLKDRFIFASEVKAIESIKEVSLSLNRQALWDFPSFLWVPEPLTAYNEVSALPRGTYLKFSQGKKKIIPFKPKSYFEPITFKTEREAIKLTRQIVEDSITSRLLSDVPVGSFLSGGLDSSIVASTAAKELDRLDTFTIAFEDIDDPFHGKIDESEAAAKTAESIGSNHHTVPVTAKDFKESLNDFVKFGDLPFSVSSGLGIMSVSKVARDMGIKVLLTGDGADECFGGYSWYENIFDKEKFSFSEPPNHPFSFQNIGKSISQRTKILKSMEPVKRAFAWHYYADEEEKKLLFSDPWQQNIKSSLRFFKNLKDKDTPLEFIKHDRNFYFPNEMLRKVDRMGMAHSVEGRTPFASPEVLALSDSLKVSHMYKGGKLKWILRKAFEDILSKEVIERPKHGFNVPIDHWLKNVWYDLLQETFEKGSSLHKENIISSNAMDHALQLLNDKNRLNGHTLFSFITLNKWLSK